MKVRHWNRLRRNRVARAIRMRGTDIDDGPRFGGRKVDGKLTRSTIVGNLHSQEIQQI